MYPLEQESILPSHLEEARRKVIKTHKKLYFIFLTGIAVVMILNIMTFQYPSSAARWIKVTSLLVSLSGYMILALLFFNRSLNKVASKVGYMCPYCHKSLYQWMSWDVHVEVTGRCPSCKKALTKDAESIDDLSNITAPGTFMDGLPKKKLPIFFLTLIVLMGSCFYVISLYPRDVIAEYRILVQIIAIAFVMGALTLVVKILKK